MIKFWKIYFWLLVGMYILAVAGYIFARSHPSLQHIPQNHIGEAFSVITIIGALAGVYGYSYRKVILTSNAWKVIFLFVIAVDIYGLSRVFTDDIELPPFTTGAVVRMVLGQLIMLPQYIALFLYGWKSHKLWDSA